MRGALSLLRPQLRDVLESRFGLDGEEQTLESIGETMNLTRERIRQIEAIGFRKLRHPTRSKRLKPYQQLSEWWQLNRYDGGVNGRYRAPLRNYVRAREGF